jgi:hypothetical protein
MTTKEQLHELVDVLGEEQADELLQFARRLAEEPWRDEPEPSWFGAMKSDRSDLGRNHEEILKAELGRSA